MSQEFTAGASAARNKLAAFLRKHGLQVETSRYGCPPTDEDFLESVLSLLKNHAQDGQLAMVIFRWPPRTYQFLVSSSVIDKLSHSEACHYLFSAKTDDKYRPDRFQHHFFLPPKGTGEDVIPPGKGWRKTSQMEDTTILYIDE